jgi:hypothetical protein
MADPIRAADLALLDRAEGLFVGMLDGNELAAFNRLCEAGAARRTYEGAAGFMGLAKVSLLKERFA